MTRWFRMYDEMLDDHKVQSLSPELFKTWANLLAVASRNNGILPPVEKLAFALRVSNHEMQSRLEDLVLCGLFDLRTDGQYEPHNWPKRQWKSDDSADRVRKHRASKRGNGDVTVTATPPDIQNPEAETETENKLQLSKQDAARGKSELGFNSISKSSGSEGKWEALKRQAEGFGLDVDELVEITNRNKPKKREGYFVTLCVNRLKAPLAGLDEQIIRDALNGKHEQTKLVTSLLMGVVP